MKSSNALFRPSINDLTTVTIARRNTALSESADNKKQSLQLYSSIIKYIFKLPECSCALAGQMGGAIHLSLNFWFFWFKPKEHIRKNRKNNNHWQNVNEIRKNKYMLKLRTLGLLSFRQRPVPDLIRKGISKFPKIRRLHSLRCLVPRHDNIRQYRNDIMNSELKYCKAKIIVSNLSFTTKYNDQ